MFFQLVPFQIRLLYLTSLLLSLSILVLALLDLGFGSLFLGIIGSIVVLLHHASTAFLIRGTDHEAVPLLMSFPSLFSVALLSTAWLTGSIVVTIWGSFYINGKAEMVVQLAGTPKTVLAQGVVGLIESLVLLSIFATLIHTRKQYMNKGHLLPENKARSQTDSPMSSAHASRYTSGFPPTKVTFSHI